jgi:hypothetical protein
MIPNRALPALRRYTAAVAALELRLQKEFVLRLALATPHQLLGRVSAQHGKVILSFATYNAFQLARNKPLN